MKKATQINPFEIPVYFFKEKEEMIKQLLTYEIDDREAIDLSDARTQFILENRGTVVIGWFTDDISDLMHECNHAILFTYQHLGLDPLDSLGEHFCYTSQKLFKDLMNL